MAPRSPRWRAAAAALMVLSVAACAARTGAATPPASPAGKASSSPAARPGSALLQEILANPSPVKASGHFKLGPGEIRGLTEALIQRVDANLNRTAASAKAPSWAATMQPFVESDSLSSIISNVINFPSSVSTDAAARNASLAAADRLSQWSVDALQREDVYAAMKAFNATPEARALTGERLRMLNDSMRGARRAGLELPKPRRAELAVLLKRMSKLALDFQACLDADTTTVSVAPEDLKGVQPDFIASKKRDPKDPTKLILTMKYPDYVPVMEDCSVESTRKRMEFAYNNVCAKENSKRLDELIRVRSQVAILLGYPTWAAYVQDELMAKSPARVHAFLTELQGRLKPLLTKQLGVLLAMKKADKAAAKAPFEPVVRSFEHAYYMNQVTKRDYAVDAQKLKEYFPIEHVVQQMLGVYQELLGLRFTKDPQLSAAAWAPGVEAFRVTDAKTGERIGTFYLDLHPRDGKFGHAAMFPLQPSSLLQTGTGEAQRLDGVAALVTNFPASTATQPSLLPHGDVVTLFHEFGHAMHQLLGRTAISSYAGTSVDTDFVEAPSQMLENWVWQKDVLRRVTKHYKTGQPMPDALIDKLIKSKNANGAITNSRQLAFGLFDQAIHTSANASSDAAFNATMAAASGVVPQAGTHPAARFGHMVGYDARYYSYLWSEVFSADMFYSRFLKEGLFNPKPGMDYRTEVLAPGGSQDPDALLRRFLGREPTQDAFLLSLGLDSGAHHGGGAAAAGAGAAARGAAGAGVAGAAGAGAAGASGGGGGGAAAAKKSGKQPEPAGASAQQQARPAGGGGSGGWPDLVGWWNALVGGGKPAAASKQG